MRGTIRKCARVSCFIVPIAVVAGCDGDSSNEASPTPSPVSVTAGLNLSGDSLHKLVTHPSFWSKASVADRRCVAGPNCPSGGTVRVRIFAARGAKDFGANTTAPVPIGKMVNDGQATTKMYGLEPGYDYLVFLVPGGTADTGRFAIERVERTGAFAHRTVASGPQIPCGHPVNWPNSFAVFRSCAQGPPDTNAVVWSTSTADGKRVGGLRTANMLGFLSLFQDTPENPAWFTCRPHGCCTSGYAAE